eukprot:gene11647-21892_t
MAGLSVWDYVVFGVMLISSSIIGIYYGCKAKGRSTKEYLIAGGSMHWFPISMSLLASFFSAVGLMGIPAEVYTYGVSFIFHVIGFTTTMILAAHVYAPIFYKSRITSANEYLEMRFSSGVRLLGCILLILQYVLYLSVVLFAPSLALEAVAGVPLATSVLATGLVCTFYTTLGGMKAVIWTDVLQAAIMTVGMVTVIVFGVSEVGGLGNVMEIAARGKRTVLNWDPDPTVRSTVWTYGIGGMFALLQNWTTSQVSVQRFLSAASLQHVKKALYINIIYLIIAAFICCSAGLVAFAVFADCDPRSARLIASNDQVIPYYVVSRLGRFPGVSGLFMACLLSGALSTLSSGLNSLAAVTLEDIVKRIKPDIKDGTATLVTKVAACMYGVLVVCMTFAMSYAGTMVLQLAVTIFGVLASPQFAMFTLGMLIPRATSVGAYVGTATGALSTAWLAGGALIFRPDKKPLPVSVYKCWSNSTMGNFTTWESGIVQNKMMLNSSPTAKFHAISYMYYSVFGIIVTFGVGLLVTLLCSHGDPEKINPDLLYDYKSALRSCLPKCCRREKKRDFYDSELEMET